MGRIKGQAPLNVALEVEKRQPLDAKSVVDAKADLTSTSVWGALDWNEYTYLGMTVTVGNDGVNNWVYVLVWTDFTDISNWKNIWEIDYIDAPTWTYIYIDSVNWDDNNDWSDWANAFKTIQRGFRNPYDWLLNVKTKGNFSISRSDVTAMSTTRWAVRFIGSVTEEFTWVNTTFVDKFNFSTTTDLTGIDASNWFIWKHASFWPYQGYPINSNTANTMEVSYYKKLPSAYKTIFSLNDTINFEQRNFDTIANFYFLNYNITFTSTSFQVRKWFRPSYSNIDMTNISNWLRKLSGESSTSPLYSFSWCRVSNIWNYFVSSVWWQAYHSILKGNGNSRMFYAGDWLGGWDLIIEDAHDVIWSSRSWKSHIGWNYGLLLRNVVNFATLSTSTEFTFFNYDNDWYSIKVENVDYLLDFVNYEQGTGIANTIVSINQAISWVLNNWYINHNWYKSFKYIDMSNNVAINIAWTFPEYTHNKEEILSDNSTWSLVVGNTTENVVCVVKYSMTRWTDVWEWEIRILTDWTIVTDNQTLQQTNPMWLTLSSSLNGNDIQLDWTTTNTGNDIAFEYTVDRKMKF